MREPSAFDTTSQASDGFGDDTADVPAVGRKLGGRYRTVRQLGSGGMGTVYEVISDDNRRLALKLLEGAAPERFVREARAAQSIDDEHVVRTLEVGTDDVLGRPFMVMELLEGRDLARVLAEHAPLAPDVVARIGVQAARGLAAAHSAGIVHRDVKPSNIFLHQTGDGVCVKLCDFGIAKRVSEIGAEQASLELTRTGGFLGSPRYMSPEQAKSARRVDARSDVWSLCVTLHEALTGEELWSGKTSLGEVIVAICTEPMTPLSRAAPWVSPALARAVERGLERDPDRRWQSMEELERELSRHVGERAELAPDDLEGFVPPSSARRSRLPYAIGLGAVAVGGIAAFFLTRTPPPAEPAAEPSSEAPIAPAPVAIADPAAATVDAAALPLAATPAPKPRARAAHAATTPEPSAKQIAPTPASSAVLPPEPHATASQPSAPPTLKPKDEW